jgi:hypothetical protein
MSFTVSRSGTLDRKPFRHPGRPTRGRRQGGPTAGMPFPSAPHVPRTAKAGPPGGWMALRPFEGKFSHTDGAAGQKSLKASGSRNPGCPHWAGPHPAQPSTKSGLPPAVDRQEGQSWFAGRGCCPRPGFAAAGKLGRLRAPVRPHGWAGSRGGGFSVRRHVDPSDSARPASRGRCRAVTTEVRHLPTAVAQSPIEPSGATFIASRRFSSSRSGSMRPAVHRASGVCSADHSVSFPQLFSSSFSQSRLP